MRVRAQTVEMIRPRLHHLAPLGESRGVVVGGPDLVPLRVGPARELLGSVRRFVSAAILDLAKGRQQPRRVDLANRLRADFGDEQRIKLIAGLAERSGRQRRLLEVSRRLFLKRQPFAGDALERLLASRLQVATLRARIDAVRDQATRLVSPRPRILDALRPGTRPG